MIDESTIEDARSRDGEPAEQRDKNVDSLLDFDELGEGQPLVRESYAAYPNSAEEMSNPRWIEFVRDLLSHAAVTDIDDALAELPVPGGSPTIERNWRNALLNLAESADLDVDALLDSDDSDMHTPADARAALTEDMPDPLDDEDNPLYYAHLYVEEGLGVEEIATLVEPSEEAVRRRLHSLGLVERKYERSSGGETTVEEARVENPELDVNEEAVEADDSITIETNE